MGFDIEVDEAPLLLMLRSNIHNPKCCRNVILGGHLPDVNIHCPSQHGTCIPPQ